MSNEALPQTVEHVVSLPLCAGLRHDLVRHSAGLAPLRGAGRLDRLTEKLDSLS
jgi:hypothetical protein